MKTIYIIKNDINNFVYIGQTEQTLDNRLKHHFSNIKSGKTKFVKAMRTIGKTHFYIEEIEKVSDEKANERELYWIQYYSKITKIYNTKFSLENAEEIHYQLIQIIMKYLKKSHKKYLAEKMDILQK